MPFLISCICCLKCFTFYFFQKKKMGDKCIQCLRTLCKFFTHGLSPTLVLNEWVLLKENTTTSMAYHLRYCEGSLLPDVHYQLLIRLKI